MGIFNLKNQFLPAASRDKSCLLHWEITSRCDLHCKFCYRGTDIPADELSYEDCLKVLDSYREFALSNNLSASLIFTGGDPFLRNDFLDILKVADEYRRSGGLADFTILANPTLIDRAMARRLKALGAPRLQLSIDGLEAAHDALRQPGSFRQTINALRCLKSEGVGTSVKSTLCRLNARDLVDVIRLMMTEGTNSFQFSQLVLFGDAKNLQDERLAPAEYRRILMDVINLLDTVPVQYDRLKYSVLSAEHLFIRLFYELGRPADCRKLIESHRLIPACGKGFSFSVLPDGTVRARRFIPEKIGQAPRDSFQEIYDSSGLVRSLETGAYIGQKKAQFEKCRNCPVVDYCGNMMADSYAASENPHAPNPMCWVE